MDDPWIAPRGLLGRLHLHLGGAGSRQRGLDRFAGLVPGADARAGANPKGFSVFQSNCTYVPNDIDAPAYTSPTIDDPCLDEGGLDQNIYGTRV